MSQKASRRASDLQNRIGNNNYGAILSLAGWLWNGIKGNYFEFLSFMELTINFPWLVEIKTQDKDRGLRFGYCSSINVVRQFLLPFFI